MKKRVLVTGVARGIGRAVAERFLNEGYDLVGTYFSSKEKAEELVDKYGTDRVILIGSYDFTSTKEIKELSIKLKNYMFDAVVFNSGMFSENDDFLGFDLEEFEKVMHCNFYAPLILGTTLKNNIVDGGSIVIVSSNDAYSGAYSSMSYSISKAALLSLTKCLCVNYGYKKIRVNSVAPGAINTDMNTPEQMNLSPKYTPIQRVGQPEEVAGVIYFLSSDDASFINGENVTIDGGYGNVSILLKSEADSMRN